MVVICGSGTEVRMCMYAPIGSTTYEIRLSTTFKVTKDDLFDRSSSSLSGNNAKSFDEWEPRSYQARKWLRRDYIPPESSIYILKQSGKALRFTESGLCTFIAPLETYCDSSDTLKTLL